MAEAEARKQCLIPRVGLGTYGGPSNMVEDIIYEAIKCGYKHLDCAAFYGNEREIGRGINRALSEGIVIREDLWVTSKVWNDHHAKERVIESCNTTLKHLQLDYLDLLLIHWPIAVKPGTNELERIPLSHTWEAMECLVDMGKTKFIGVSNFDIQLLNDLLTYCRIRPLTNQVESHVYLAQNNLLEFCEFQNIFFTAYCPLAHGGTTGRVPNPFTEPMILDIAKKHNKTPGQIMLHWNLQRNPFVVVIPKTTNASRLAENLYVEDFHLSKEEMSKLAELDCGARIIPTIGPIPVFAF